MAPVRPPAKRPGGSGGSSSKPGGGGFGGFGGFGGGAAAGFLGASFLPNIFGGLFGGGGGGGSAGGISEVISLLPLMVIGGGALYAYQTLKK